MRCLFVHQNFPAQFRHLAAALADDPANEVRAIGDARLLARQPVLHPRIRTLGYKVAAPTKPVATHHYLRDHEAHVRRGQDVVRLLMKLQGEQRFTPDLVVAHPGWGEALFLRDMFPRARQIGYFEYFYQGTGGDVGFDPEFPATLDDRLRVRMKNNTQLQCLVASDRGISPTHWQRSRYPAEFLGKIDVVHEGVDTGLVKPDPDASFTVAGRRFTARDEVVTYVARNLEPYRGFPSFMRMLPRLQSLRPQANVLIVGGDEVSYGRRLPDGETYRARLQQELDGQVDWSRVHFVGKLPYVEYLRVLQISSVHVYLTYPFVLSWSMLEAMAAGCLVVGSATAPVQEVLEHGRNGLLVDFFDPAGITSTVVEALQTPARFAPLRLRARETVIERYDLHRICLPRQLALVR